MVNPKQKMPDMYLNNFKWLTYTAHGRFHCIGNAAVTSTIVVLTEDPQPYILQQLYYFMLFLFFLLLRFFFVFFFNL